MSFRADVRAQSVQVGAVLLFAILVIAFSTYQAFIVPEQNERVEFEHNQEVRGQLGDLRNAIVSTQGGAARSTSVSLGTQYPPRAIALNPGPPSGSLRTIGTTDPAVNVTVRNARASGEVGDFWDGSARHYDTGGIVYEPTYNRYDEAPVTGYEHTVLYDAFAVDFLVAANQSFIQGADLSLVTLDGSLQRASSGSTSVDARPVSGAERTVLIEAVDDGSPVTIDFTSRLPADRWERILSGQNHVVDVEDFPSAAGEEFRTIRVELDPDETYELEMTKAAVGTGATSEPAAYLTDVAGDGISVARGNSEPLTLEVRDAYNNPVSGVSVNASVGSGGSLDSTRETTDENGRVTFDYRTTQSTQTGRHAVNVTLNDSAVLAERPFDAGLAKNASVDVTVTDGVGSGAGVYALDWTAPSTEADNGGASLSNCDGDACTWDLGASDDDSLTLNATLDPPYQGIDLEYAGDDASVATVSSNAGETGSDGADQIQLTAEGAGTVTVLASANDDSDTIEVEVVNDTDGGGGDEVLQPVEMRDTTDRRFVFRIEHTGTDQVTVEEFSVDVTGAPNNVVLDNGNGRELQILRTSTQNGVANRNGNPTNFEPDGTYYDLVADSNQGNEGSHAIIEPEDDDVDVDFREFQPGIGEVALVDSSSEADVFVDLVLSDGPVQEFYFEYT